MALYYLDEKGFARLWYQISEQFVRKENGKGIFSGDYADLTGAPTNVSYFFNDARYATEKDVADTYLTKLDASTTYVTLTSYNDKIAALEQSDKNNLTESRNYTDAKTASALTEANAYTDIAVANTLDSAKDYVNKSINSITKFDFKIVSVLPNTGVNGIIYLVPAAEDDNVVLENNDYSEYIWITDAAGNSKYELIGSTNMDLDGYLKDDDVEYLTNDEIDSIYNQVINEL